MTAAMNTAPPPLAPAGPGTDRETTARVPPDVPLDSATLLQGGKAVTIRHNGEFYRLQATRQGKLILTK
jgi:hemin uptake protein HemP